MRPAAVAVGPGDDGVGDELHRVAAAAEALCGQVADDRMPA
jgi:hypothetical protein